MTDDERLFLKLKCRDPEPRMIETRSDDQIRRQCEQRDLIERAMRYRGPATGKKK